MGGGARANRVPAGMNPRAADIHPLPTAAPVFEARAAVDKAWISAPPATTALGAQRLHDPTTPPPTPNSVAHQPRNCEGTGTSDDKTGQTGASKTWLIRRRLHNADRSIRSVRAHLIEASKGRAPSSTGRIYDRNPVPVTLKPCLAIREETIYGLAEGVIRHRADMATAPHRLHVRQAMDICPIRCGGARPRAGTAHRGRAGGERARARETR